MNKIRDYLLVHQKENHELLFDDLHANMSGRNKVGVIAIESIIFVHHRVIVGLRAYTDWTNLKPSGQILTLVDKS
jgi:hypothetical protein